jgi:cytochrome c-type biogenesis protein CcmH
MNARAWLIGLAAALLIGASPVSAVVEVREFETPEQEDRYDKMISELRCLVCQNQNLADSNAELAVDMRRKTYEMVMQGKSEKEIGAFMVERYGDFVLYRPPLNNKTLLLWTGPFIILLVGVTILLRTIQKRRTGQVDPVDDTRLKTAAALLDGDSDKRDA